jgi:molybdopterin molybdotransferase
MMPHDVRMSGFRSRSTVDQAWAWLDAAVPGHRAQKLPEQREEQTTVPRVLPSPRLTPSETLSLELAYGRVLTEAVRSDIDVPGFDRSAMDGYALRARETVGAGEYNPITLRIVGEALPGRGFEGTLRAGEAVRIMTGAPIPEGADAVVPAEYARESASGGEGAIVELTATVGEFKHIGRRGEDIAAGEVVLPAGRVLRPQDVAVLASIGRDRVMVDALPDSAPSKADAAEASPTGTERPAFDAAAGSVRVRIIVTGNELVRPGQPRETHQIYEANSYLLRGLIPRDGGMIESVSFVTDEREEIRRHLLEPGADVILISGGSSVGAEDHAPSLVQELGELAIHGIAMRPSSPTGIGRLGETLVFLLPGNPVSCLCAYDFFAGRAIRMLGGGRPDWPYPTVRGRLVRKIVSTVGRTDYCRVRVTESGIEPLAISGASILSSTTRADGFVIVPPESEGLPTGMELEVQLYQPG